MNRKLSFYIVLLYSSITILLASILGASTYSLVFAKIEQQFGRQLKQSLGTIAESVRNDLIIGNTRDGIRHLNELTQNGLYERFSIKSADFEYMPDNTYSSGTSSLATVVPIYFSSSPQAEVWGRITFFSDLGEVRETSRSVRNIVVTAVVGVGIVTLLLALSVLGWLYKSAMILSVIVEKFAETLTLPPNPESVSVIWSPLLVRLQAGAERIAEMRAQVIHARQNEAIARMTQMLAHDVRRPFSLLKVTLGMLEKANSPEATQKILNIAKVDVHRAIVSVDGLVQDVMEIGAKGELSIEHVQADTLIHSALVDTFRIYPKADVQVEVSLLHRTDLLVDTGKVMRVFMNIMGNGVQAMNQKGKMWVRTAQKATTNNKDFVEFVIGNNGPAIPTADVLSLFEAFFTKNKKGGTGLGLAIAKKVVLAHGGDIWCESNDALGVEFHFTLPCGELLFQQTHEFPMHARDLTALTIQATQSSGVRDVAALELVAIEKLRALGRPMRVLIVDDEALYRNAVMEHLRENEEVLSLLNIGVAKNSSEAHAAVRVAGGGDLAIFDVDLGAASVNGFELLSELRNDGFSALACIHTNRVLLGDNKKAMECGADVFLPKPMSRSHLLKLVIQAAEKISAE